MRALGDREEGAVAALTKELKVYTEDEVGPAGRTGTVPSRGTIVGVALREATSAGARDSVDNKSDGAELDCGLEAGSVAIGLADEYVTMK